MDHFVAAFFYSDQPTQPVYIVARVNPQDALRAIREYVDMSPWERDDLETDGQIIFSPNHGPESFCTFKKCECRVPNVHVVRY